MDDELGSEFAALSRKKTAKVDQIAKLTEQLNIEKQIKAGAENMFSLMETQGKDKTPAYYEIERQIHSTNKKIAHLAKEIDELATSADISSSRQKIRRTSLGNSPEFVQFPKERRVSSSRKSLDNSQVSSVTVTMQKAIYHIGGQTDQALDYMNATCRIFKSFSAVETFVNVPMLVRVLVKALAHTERDLRSTAYKTLRYICVDIPTIKEIINNHIEIFVARSLTKDHRYDSEKEQAFKLIRVFVDFDQAWMVVPQGIVRAIVATAETPDEKYRKLAIETLCELAIRNTEIVALCGGITPLLSIFTEGPKEYSDMVVLTFLYLLDHDQTRKYIRPNVELEVIVSCFTDPNEGNEEKMLLCSKALALLIKSWSGLIYLCMHDRKAIRSLVEILKLSQSYTRKYILELLYEIFMVQVPDWYFDYVSTKNRLAQYYKPREFPQSDSICMLRQYLALVLIVFIEADLMEALSEVVQDPNKHVAARGIVLVSELQDLCNMLLPSEYTNRVNAMSALFTVATFFEDEKKRQHATRAIVQLDSLHAASDGNTKMNEANNAKNLQGLRRTEEAKMKIDTNADEALFESNLLEADVMSAKEYSKWDWDLVMDIFDILLRDGVSNPAKVSEVVKGFKFVKKCLVFFRPSSQMAFSDLKDIKTNRKYVRLGGRMLRALLMHDDGMNVIEESGLFQEIAYQLTLTIAQEPQTIFSAVRIEDSVAKFYFKFVSELLQKPRGIRERILERSRLLTALYKVTELQDRDDLIDNMIKNFRYSNDGHERILVAKALQSNRAVVRRSVLLHLKEAFNGATSQTKEFLVGSLVSMLCDDNYTISQLALQILEDAVRDSECLDHLIEHLNFILHLDIGMESIIIRSLSSVKGIQYLKEAGYLDTFMNNWAEYGIDKYCSEVETGLFHRLIYRDDVLQQVDNGLGDASKMTSFQVPPHFFGELTRTQIGCDVLNSHGFFGNWCQYLRRFKSSRNLNSSKRIKAILWTFAHIGANVHGLALLESQNIVSEIVRLAHNSPILSIRGTCYFVLSLISTNPHAVEILLDHGWEAVRRPNTCFGICVPQLLYQFLDIPDWNYAGSFPSKKLKYTYQPTSLLPDEEQVLVQAGNLANFILQAASIKFLSRVRQENPDVFASVDLYVEIQRLLSAYHYRLSIRRYLLDLFDASIVSDGFDRICQLKGVIPTGSEELRDVKIGSRHASAESLRSDRDCVAHKEAKEVVQPASPPRVVLAPLKVIKGFAV